MSPLRAQVSSSERPRNSEAMSQMRTPMFWATRRIAAL
jgi:hypothetical protein